MLNEKEHEATEVIHDSLDTCEELISSERGDQRQLALESLIHMTDPQECSQSTARQAAHTLLAVTADHDQIHDGLVHILRGSAGRSRTASLKYEYAKGASPEADSKDRAMAVLSLTALSNALKVAKAHGNYTIDTSGCSWRSIAAVLKECLRDAARHPQEAVLGIKCVGLMGEINPEWARMFSGDELFVEYLLKARRYGAAHYRMLERESENLLQRLSAALQNIISVG